MRTIKVITLAALSAFAVGCCGSYEPNITTSASPMGTDVFKADSISIAQQYKMPQWFQDGKLGIFIHWGVYSVPAYGSEWYSRLMYDQTSDIYKYHVKTYGEVDKFGYKDFIPMFKAEQFDSEQWAELFKESGATYVVPVAEHHDGFAMYHSAFNPWNAVEMGPKRDIIGELSKSVRAQGMHFGVSSHRAENAWFYNQGMKIPSDVQDMSISLYGERIEEPEGQGMTAYCGKYPGSNEKSRSEWLKHTYELIDQYQPDLIWFDWTVGKYPFQPAFYQFMAYYYNNAKDWGKDVVVNSKVGYGDESQIFDIERGKSDRILRWPWQTDSSVGKKSWSFTPDEENKTPNHVIDDFVDIVSKNGNLLLNIGPRSDGTITEEQQYVLRELGHWLSVNSEAIYGSRPWVSWGEGDNRGTAGYMTDGEATHYDGSDMRFTTNNGALYAIMLEYAPSTLIKSLNNHKVEDLKVNSISLLGSDEKLDWKQTAKGVEVALPAAVDTNYAYSLKIDYDGVALGDMQIHKLNGRLMVEQYIINNCDEAVTYSLECRIKGGDSIIKDVTIAAGEKVMSDFLFSDVVIGDAYDVELLINGKLFDAQTVVPMGENRGH